MSPGSSFFTLGSPIRAQPGSEVVLFSFPSLEILAQCRARMFVLLHGCPSPVGSEKSMGIKCRAKRILRKMHCTGNKCRVNIQ